MKKRYVFKDYHGEIRVTHSLYENKERFLECNGHLLVPGTVVIACIPKSGEVGNAIQNLRG